MSEKKTIPIHEERPESSPCESSEPYVLMVLGDSMEPEFEEGEVIVIEPDGAVGDGSFVIAYHNDDYTFRQLIQRDGSWYLHALKEGYPDEPLPDLEGIKGVVTQKKRPGIRGARKRYA